MWQNQQWWNVDFRQPDTFTHFHQLACADKHKPLLPLKLDSTTWCTIVNTNYRWYLIASLEVYEYFLKFCSKVNIQRENLCKIISWISIHLRYSNSLQFRGSNNPAVFALVLTYFTLPAYLREDISSITKFKIDV